MATDPARTLIFDGFTFRDGLATGPFSPVTIANAKPTFIHCVFEDNHADEKGGAVLIYGATSQAFFLNCAFLRNEAEGLGGAVALVGSTLLAFQSSTVAGNTAAGDPAFHDPESAGVGLTGTVVAYNGGAPSATFSHFSALPDVSLGDTAWLTWAVAQAPPAPQLDPPGVALPGSPLSAGSFEAGPLMDDGLFTLTTGQGAFQAAVTHTRRGLRDAAWGVVPLLPAKVEAEDFDQLGKGASYRDQTPINEGGAYRPLEAVDIAAVGSASNGHIVGWTEAGAWLEYTVRAPAALNGRIEVAVAAATPGGSFYVQVDGETVGPVVEIPDTGGWTAWRLLSVPGVSLTGGLHQVRFVIVRGGFNFDYWQFFEATLLLGRSPPRLWRSVKEGNVAVAQGIQVRNDGAGSFSFETSIDAAWLSVTPDQGTVGSEPQALTVSYDSAGLAVGTYEGTITLTRVGSAHPPRTVVVTLNVRPQGAYHLDFDSDGSADLGVYSPPGGNWYIFGTQRGFFTDQFGYTGTLPLGGPPATP